MSTKEIASRLVALCRQGKFEDAQKELFSTNAKSIEAEDSPMQPRETKGLDGIIAKGHEFQASVEKIHSMSISEPLVAEDSFACTMTLDVTMKGRGRNTMSEVCVYDVRDGKITAEQFH
ncbi:MAG TPA: nuclear transport factor 2 family protein [Opitutaceae bacterium]|jgi:hypothetical protein